MLFCFDFDKTITNIGFHGFRKHLFTNDFGSITGEERGVQELFHQPDFFKNKKKLLQVMNDVLKHGNNIAITTFSKFGKAIPKALLVLGLTHEQVKTIKVISGKPPLSDNDKNWHIIMAMAHFGIRNTRENRKKVVLIDDVLNHVIKARKSGFLGLHVNDGMPNYLTIIGQYANGNFSIDLSMCDRWDEVKPLIAPAKTTMILFEYPRIIQLPGQNSIFTPKEKSLTKNTQLSFR